MTAHRTFTQKVGAGFAVTVLLTVTIGVVGVVALRQTVSAMDRVAVVDAQQLVDMQRLRVAAERKVVGARTFLLTGSPVYLDQMRDARSDFTALSSTLKNNLTTPDERSLLDAVIAAESDHQRALDAVIALRQSGADMSTVVREFDGRAAPARDALDQKINTFTSREQVRLDAARHASTARASTAGTILVVLAIVAALLAAAIAVVLTRALGRQIGTAVGQVQTSSTELEAAATQQAAGARQEATAMSEITTTFNELMVTSRQIADSAQRVSQIAEETAAAARSGDDTISQAQSSIDAIRQQVDLVVHHMVELGRKSQQIGAVLDIVSEHAEQTNILAINATIEATGAGESGKRFAVVADEIRKLADRVAGSAKEIRGLIDDVRAAVNTTVMATETGSKAVDTGSRQFNQVAVAFQRIGGMVATTTDAAREIELSTKQQASAVEQVNVAVGDVAQATRATETSSAQTRQTASQLASLSTDLLRLVHARAAG
jgi:methyl-accepting chemotaxis protein